MAEWHSTFFSEHSVLVCILVSTDADVKSRHQANVGQTFLTLDQLWNNCNYTAKHDPKPMFDLVSVVWPTLVQHCNSHLCVPMLTSACLLYEDKNITYLINEKLCIPVNFCCCSVFIKRSAARKRFSSGKGKYSAPQFTLHKGLFYRFNSICINIGYLRKYIQGLISSYILVYAS